MDSPFYFDPAPPASVTAFMAIVMAVFAAAVAAVHYSYRDAAGGPTRPTLRFVLGYIIVVGGLGSLVASGRMGALPMHGLPIFFGAVFAASIGLAMSPVGARVAERVPLAALVGFQAFRLPLELVLHRWAESGTIPETMTWTGQNWDIVSGVVALLAAPLVPRFPAMARVANVIGFVLLLNVIRVAVMSSPLPFAWGQQPPLLLALHLPYALIGPVCVGGALAGHLVLTRALLRRAARAVAAT